MRTIGLLAGVTVCAISFGGCASNSGGSPTTEAPATTLSADQLDYIDCVDTLTDATMQMSIVGGDHDGGFQSIVRAFGTESEEMDLVVSLLSPTAQQAMAEGVDAALADLSPKVQNGCALMHPTGVVPLVQPSSPETRTREDRAAECASVVLGSMIDAFNRMTDGIDDDGSRNAIVEISSTYGSNSVEFAVISDLWNDFISTGQRNGLDAAINSIDTAAACTTGYELATVAAADDSPPPSTSVTTPRPVANDPNEDATTGSGESRPDTGAAPQGSLEVSAGSVAGVRLGQDLKAVKSTIDAVLGSSGDGPWELGTCTTNDTTVSWISGLAIFFDPGQVMYGYSFSDLSPGGGPGWAPDIDLAGSGLGWGASQEDISAAFPNYSQDPLLGDMIIELEDGLLRLRFEQNGLSYVGAGDICSPGGQQVDTTTKGETPPGCPIGGVDVLREGDGSPTACPAVLDAQTYLNQYGYAVAADGRFGPATTTAVRQFQTDHGLDADGLIGKKTWAQLSEARSWDA